MHLPNKKEEKLDGLFVNGEWYELFVDIPERKLDAFASLKVCVKLWFNKKEWLDKCEIPRHLVEIDLIHGKNVRNLF